MIHKGIYFVLTGMNFAFLLYSVKVSFLIPGLVFFGGILLNQYFLVKGVTALIKAQKKSAFLVIKFFVLIGVFVYALNTMPDLIALCVLSYIFQLIILALSIKRDK